MKNPERIILASLFVGGCLASPEISGAEKERKTGITPIESPVPSPIPTEIPEFLEEIQGIEVRGTADEREQTKNALRLLKQKAEPHYKNVLKYLGVSVFEILGEEDKRTTEVFPEDSPPLVLVDQKTMRAGIIWYAGGIVHEACHVQDFFRFKERFPGQSVPVEVFSGPLAEARCSEVDYDALVSLGAEKSVLDYVKNAIEDFRRKAEEEKTGN